MMGIIALRSPVLADDAPLGEAAAARGLDELLLERRAQTGAGDARDERGERDGEGDRGQRQVVDAVQARVAETEHRKPPERDRKDRNKKYSRRRTSRSTSRRA